MAKGRSSQAATIATAPSIPPQDALRLLRHQHKKGSQLLSNQPVDKGLFDAWQNTTREYLIQAFGSNSGNLFSFGRAGSYTIFAGATDEYRNQQRAEALEKELKILESAIEQLEAQLEIGESEPLIQQHLSNPIQNIERIALRFHLVARQLRDRYSDRPTLDIADEYDVQNLLHALLRLFFDDIRTEEWTPSYAGGASRMDFFLKQEKTVIEAKKTRSGLSARELGNQLIEDIARYKAHPDCRTLCCFIYDPDGRISNPHGLEHDLNRTEDGFTVRVIIAPQGL